VNVYPTYSNSDYLERSVERRTLAAQASKNGPELSFWEEHLAMKIEGVKEDVLRIVYNHISESDWMREYLFTIDLSERDYKGISYHLLD
jgi:kinetochore protein Spc25, fungi type